MAKENDSIKIYWKNIDDKDTLDAYVIHANNTNDYLKAIAKLTDNNTAVQALISNLLVSLPYAKKYEDDLIKKGYTLGELYALLK